MTSIFQRALGADFARLHPQLQRLFGFGSTDGTACVGHGVMERVWRGRAFARALRAMSGARHRLFAEEGRNIPFTMENYAYVDSFGRETFTFARTFESRRARRHRFDATMVYSERQRRIVYYLGTHQDIAVGMRMRCDPRGGLRIDTGELRLRIGAADLRLPAVLSAAAQVVEWFDERIDRFQIRVRVTNPLLGPLFGYQGTFAVTYLDTGKVGVPAMAKPLREEARE